MVSDLSHRSLWGNQCTALWCRPMNIRGWGRLWNFRGMPGSMSSITPNGQGRWEESLNGILAARMDMESGTLCRVNLALGPPYCFWSFVFSDNDFNYGSLFPIPQLYCCWVCLLFYYDFNYYGYRFLVLFQIPEMSRRLLVLCTWLLGLPWFC